MNLSLLRSINQIKSRYNYKYHLSILNRNVKIKKHNKIYKIIFKTYNNLIIYIIILKTHNKMIFKTHSKMIFKTHNKMMQKIK